MMNRTLNFRISFFSLVLMLIAFGCKDDKKVEKAVEDPYLKELKETQIGDIDFYISIPKGYTIKENRGPDFSVYYFFPKDTTNTQAFTGGMYFGNHPSQFDESVDSCKTKKIKSIVLSKDTEWTSIQCKTRFSLQTIIESGSTEGWNSYIHAFAHTSSESDLKKVLTIFKTLKKKKPQKRK